MAFQIPAGIVIPFREGRPSNALLCLGEMTMMEMDVLGD